VLHTGPLTLPLGALALFIGWFYSAPPIKASYRGLGELFIGVGQGLVIFGAYYVQRGASMLPLVVSVPWFLALPALKIIRQYPDYDADLTSGKRGLAAIVGRAPMAGVYVVLIVLAMLSLVPIALTIRSPSAVLLVIPSVLLGRSALVMARGEWRDRERLERAAVDGFVGMLTIPLALTLAFLIPALFVWVR
jgi:1,4-dihydroxy-2-naphthoate octaprenyltransferase